MGTKMSSTAKTRQQSLQRLQAFAASGVVKRAALGGEQETAFEQSFASLAYTYIQDKAPSLMDYLVGFQLVDKREDNTKAVGIFGFKLGEQWAYVPVFFLNGDLRGHELLYLKNQDTFVPLKENWVNYVLARRPHVLGDPSSENAQQLGITEPNYNVLGTPPNNKFAASRLPPNLPDWLKPAMPKLASWVTQSPALRCVGLENALDLDKFVRQDVRLVKLARDVGRAYPDVKSAMDALYGKSMLYNALLDMRKEALQADVLSKQSADAIEQEVLRKRFAKRRGEDVLSKESADDETSPSDKVEVITDSITREYMPDDLSDQEKQKLIRDGYVVRDSRSNDEVAKVYNVQSDMALTNPDATDTYQLLTKPGKFEECLIIKHPFGSEGKNTFVTVVRMSGDKTWKNTAASSLFVKQQARAKSDVQEFGGWFDALSNEGRSLQQGATYIAVSPSGAGTTPFVVEHVYGDGQYSVDFEDYGYYGCGNAPVAVGMSYDDRADSITFDTRDGTVFRLSNKTVYVPTDAKAIKLRDPATCRKCSKPEATCKCDYFSADRSRDTEPLKPGQLVDLQLQIMNKTSELKVCTDQHEVIINRLRMPKMAAFIHLVRHHGLRENQAKHVIKEAERYNGVRYRIKYAYPMGPYETGMGMSAPALPEPPMGTDPMYGGVQTMMPMEQTQQVPDMSAANSDLSGYDPMQMIDPAAMQTAQAGQQQGQKEIFDTTMIASMLKAVRDDSLVDRYMGPLVNALDKLARILFMLYWHSDEFRERYGKQDLPELEDTTRNAFEVLGDLVLFLRQKSIGSTIDSRQFSDSSIDSAARL